MIENYHIMADDLMESWKKKVAKNIAMCGDSPFTGFSTFPEIQFPQKNMYSVMNDSHSVKQREFLESMGWML